MGFEIDKDFALLYGILLGDGCLILFKRKDRPSNLGIISITGSLRGDLPFFQKVLVPILNKFSKKGVKIIFRKDCEAIEIKLYDRSLLEYFSSLGFPIGKKLDNLFIPKIFYDQNLVNYVIAGFFATDGSIVLAKNSNKYYPRLEIHVIAKRLLGEVYNYLSLQGFKGGFYECKRTAAHPNSYRSLYTKYRIQLNGSKT